jgi:hypothetical protein
MTNATTVPGGLAAREPATPPARTPAEIEADIERTRARLADTVDAIAERVKPANVARRTFVDAHGNLQVRRVAVLAAVVAGAAGLIIWRRSR